MTKTVNFIPPEKIKCFDLVKDVTLTNISFQPTWSYQNELFDFYFHVILQGPRTIHVHFNE